MKLEDTVLTTIRAHIEAQKEVSLESDLREDLALDSFGTIMVINGLEEALGISIQESDFSRVRTVADVVNLLKEKYCSAPASLAA